MPNQTTMNIRAIPSLADNYIWLITFDEHQAVVVDPAEAGPVLDILNTENLDLKGILITHQCFDHVGGINSIVSHYPAPVYGPASEPIPGMTHPLREGNAVNIGGTTFSVLDTPGHTAGHIVFYGGGVLLCGDLLFAAGCGRVHTRRPDWMFESLGKIKQLPQETRVYCAHEYTLANLKFAHAVEPDNADIIKRQHVEQKKRQRGLATVPFTLNEELLTNPFLRCNAPAVKAAAEKFSGQPLSSEAEVFRIIRDWKDTFA